MIFSVVAIGLCIVLAGIVAWHNTLIDEIYSSGFNKQAKALALQQFEEHQNYIVELQTKFNELANSLKQFQDSYQRRIRLYNEVENIQSAMNHKILEKLEELEQKTRPTA